MALLWLITVIWAFSFSLIGVYLHGQVDDYIAVASRMALAFIIFVPFFQKVTAKQALIMMATGAVEIAGTYLFLYHSYQYLTVPELLLFTIFTPLYVSLFADLFAKRKPYKLWLPALLAVAGAAVIRWAELSEDYWLGFAYIQGANACFAFGQVWYRHQSQSNQLPHRARFFWFFAGALLVSGAMMLAKADWTLLPDTTSEISVLLWLGIVTSGLGYLAWSYGSTKVNAQQLAVMNNMLIPAGIAVNVLFWNGQVSDWPRLIAGCVCMVAALWAAKRYAQPAEASA